MRPDQFVEAFVLLQLQSPLVTNLSSEEHVMPYRSGSTTLPPRALSASPFIGIRGLLWSVLLISGVSWCGAAFAQPDGSTPASSLDLELGLFTFTRNDVRIPGDTGTRFALDDLTDTSGVAARLQGTWWLNERHALRLTAAPLS
ncbi:MAG: hypothetical protein EA419_03215, partial [Wenzhouxiangella sp.]